MQLQVDWLKLGAAPLLHTPGRLGLSVCPGRPEISGGLAADVASLKAARVGAVLSLVDEAEMRLYGVAGLPQALDAAGIAHLSYPIVDGLPPTDLPGTRALCLRVLGRLGEGDNVLLHCIGGWGRSGTLAAALLCHEGHSPRRAIELVRRARSPRCIESMAQEVFVHKYAQQQRGFRRRYLFVARPALAAHLSGAPGERVCMGGPGTRLATTAEQLTRFLMQLHHERAADEVVVFSGEVPEGAPPAATLSVDRAYRIDGPGLIPVPFSAP